MIESRHGSIDYDESGVGSTVVLVPGSCSTGAAWRPIVSQWRGGFRAVTTSLLGYGGTVERRTAVDTDISLEAEIVETVIRRTAAPVHLVGHSFGGLVALAVALRDRVPLLSLSILEAPGPEILRQMSEHGHYHAFRDMTDRYIGAYRGGDREAIAAMIDFYGGPGTFAAWPERVRDYAIATTPVNILDWASCYGFRPTPAALSSIDVPALVLWGGLSHPSARRANELLGRCLIRPRVVAIAGAAHFMIATHAREVAGVLAQHMLCSEDADGFSLSAAGANW